MKKLIVNADDFGISHAVNKAVLNCFLCGSLDSATLMVNMPCVEEAVEMSLKNQLSVGLHFNLTLGRPVSDVYKVNSLVDTSGSFYSRRDFVKRYFLNKISHDDIKLEFIAQANRFMSFGLKLDHIDSHQHIHVLPKLFDRLAAFCVENKVPLRMLKQGNVENRGFNKFIRRLIIQNLNARNEKKWTDKLMSNNYLTSVFDYMPNNSEISFELYKSCIENLKTGVTELMVHPITNASTVEKDLTRISAISQIEYDVLVSTQFMRLLKQEEVQRCRFSRL